MLPERQGHQARLVATVSARRELLTLVGAVRRLAFDRTLPPSEALGRIRDAFNDYDHPITSVPLTRGGLYASIHTHNLPCLISHRPQPLTSLSLSPSRRPGMARGSSL
jgi:hypothetical protein